MIETVQWQEGWVLASASAQVRDYLTGHGLPVETILFQADEVADEPFTIDTGQNLVRIGSFDEDFRFFVDLAAGSVYFGLDNDPNPSFSNSSLDAFISCLLWIDEKFPFYAFGDSPEAKRKAGRAVEEFIRAIDPLALEIVGAFWPDFVHDVCIGDYYDGSL